MKKLLIGLVCALLLTSTPAAIAETIVIGQPAGCIAQQSYTGYTTVASCASAVSNAWNGASFTTPAVGYTVSAVRLCLYKNNSPTMNITAKFYATDGTDPDTQTGADSTALDATTLTTTNNCTVMTTFVFPTPVELAAATGYWLVLYADAVDATNYFKWRADDTGGKKLR